MPDSDIFVAKENFFATELNTMVKKGERVRRGHPLLRGREDLFDPVDLVVTYDIETATSAPGEKRGQSPAPAQQTPSATQAAPSPYEGLRQAELLDKLQQRGIEVPRQRGTVSNKTLVDLLVADDATKAQD